MLLQLHCSTWHRIRHQAFHKGSQWTFLRGKAMSFQLRMKLWSVGLLSSCLYPRVCELVCRLPMKPWCCCSKTLWFLLFAPHRDGGKAEPHHSQFAPGVNDRWEMLTYSSQCCNTDTVRNYWQRKPLKQDIPHGNQKSVSGSPGHRGTDPPMCCQLSGREGQLGVSRSFHN